MALKYVKNQTDEICLAAVKQNDKALKYVKIIHLKYLEAVRKNIFYSLIMYQ